MQKSFVLGIDQGTSGSRALVIDDQGLVRGYAYRPLPRIYPHPDWVEQDPATVADSVREAVAEALDSAGCAAAEVAAAGITCQRNTEFVWESTTGRSLGNAITWQDMRTLPLLDELAAWPLAGEVRERLGYPPAPYMTALHLAWRLRHEPAVAAAARAGTLRVGMSASWLIEALGEPAGHFLDASLVQSTGLYDIRAGEYWATWCAWLGVPVGAALPRTVPTIHDYGTLCVTDGAGRQAHVPVLATIGDQQAALFGHGAREAGQAACTHGTASYVEAFLGGQAPASGTLDTLCAWNLSAVDAAVGQTFAYEAQTTVTGAVLRWMHESANLLRSYGELDELVQGTPGTDGVVFIPAFTGLNVPYNDRRVRGALLGLSLGTTRGHIARAFLEAIGLQLRAILSTMAADGRVAVDALRVGGGVSASDAACQIQADLLGLPVLRPAFRETTARAAALLAGLGAGLWPGLGDLPPAPGGATHFEPRWSPAQRDAAEARWQEAIDVTRRFSRST